MRRKIVIAACAAALGMTIGCSHTSPGDALAQKEMITSAPASSTTGTAFVSEETWVLSEPARESIEEETEASFTDLANNLRNLVREACPDRTLCVRIVPQVDDPKRSPDQDCYVDRNIIPEPLHEDGMITVLVNNFCD